MSARRGPRPVIVEVRPDNVSNIAPSSPSSSPKVRFAATSTGPVAGVSRPLSSVEAWSVYHFEAHARNCDACYDPYEVTRRRQSLCPEGHALAQDVAYHVQHLHGEIYSKEREGSNFVRVEVPHGYTMLRSLLKAMDRGTKISARRAAAPPVVTYDRTTLPARRASWDDTDGPAEVILEPAHSGSHHRRKQRSRYAVVAVDGDDSGDDDAANRRDRPIYKDRKGTLYEGDMQRKKEAYRVEIREPSSRRERPRSVWM